MFSTVQTILGLTQPSNNADIIGEEQMTSTSFSLCVWQTTNKIANPSAFLEIFSNSFFKEHFWLYLASTSQKRELLVLPCFFEKKKLWEWAEIQMKFDQMFTYVYFSHNRRLNNQAIILLLRSSPNCLIFKKLITKPPERRRRENIIFNTTPTFVCCE